jgi:hypothetical protein
LEKTEPVKRATAGFAISLIAGILVLLDGIALIAVSGYVSSLTGYDLGSAIGAIGGLGIVFALIILFGAWLIYTPGKETLGGILVLIFSIISIFTGGGFFIGLVLGIIGGALGLAKK